MPDYKSCAETLVDNLMDETTSSQTGYVLAPNGKYYGLTDSSTPFLGDLDYLRYWILQDTNMAAIFNTSAVTSETTIKAWFSNNMTTTYKFMAAMQFCVAFDYSNLTADVQFSLDTNPTSGLWELEFTNGGSNPGLAPPTSPTCS